MSDLRRRAFITLLGGAAAAELVALGPDVILAYGGSVVGPLQQVSSTVPIVFVADCGQEETQDALPARPGFAFGG